MPEVNQKSKRVTVTLPPEDREYLGVMVKRAGREGRRVSISDLIREAVHGYIKNHKRRSGR